MSARHVIAPLGLAAFLVAAPTTRTFAQTCRTLQYSLEPDCLERSAAGPCRFDVARPDFGPQIAVWVESADGASFIDTLMVTNAVALYGIGNRPGRWDFRSGPRFPYGRRPMALPVWAHRRGKTYPSVVMNDGYDDALAAHMKVSSPEPHFCRPMTSSEVLDAVTCPSGLFRSAKGLLDTTRPRSYYPPRGDLLDWVDLCVPVVSSGGTSCDYGDARQFSLLNDLDAVATATPAYDSLFSATWTIPAALPDGDYALMVEVGKELDQNAAFSHGSFLSPYETTYYGTYGLDGNIGQPSVIYRIPFQIGAASIPPTATAAAIGYGDWTGADGDVRPIDDQLSATPGSGSSRLRLEEGPGGMGRVQLREVPCAPIDCATASALEVPRIDAPLTIQGATSAMFTFRQVGDQGGGPVIAYDLRTTSVPQTFLTQVDETQFMKWIPAPAPAVAAPDSLSTVTLTDLAPLTGYAIALRAKGACGWSSPGFARVSTGPAVYKKLSGCVIATAAYGSALEPDVALLRHARDAAASRSDMARLVASLYSNSAPPLAQLIARSETARAVVRVLLRPVVAITRAAAPLGHAAPR
jgi:hypothetical protein